MNVIDLRSDTVTLPTPAMRQAMAAAEVGDDVHGEDPTVNRLEALAARLLGKEAAVFVTSGVQGNQVSALAHTRRGGEVIVEALSHIYNFEAGGLAALSGCQVRPIAGHKGAMDPAQVERSISPDNEHYAPTALVSVENTHNFAGGTVVPQATIEAICAVAHRHHIPVHLDGARLFNAATATGRSVLELAAPADSVMFCLSKGLSAPVGSMVCGSADFIARARRARKLLGGAMRQAGVLAAAGIVALEQMVGRLHEDHENARHLAEALAGLPGVTVHVEAVETNMVLLDVQDTENPQAPGAADLVAAWDAVGVRTGTIGPNRIRLVTHYGISHADVHEAAARMWRAVGA